MYMLSRRGRDTTSLVYSSTDNALAALEATHARPRNSLGRASIHTAADAAAPTRSSRRQRERQRRSRVTASSCAVKVFSTTSARHSNAHERGNSRSHKGKKKSIVFCRRCRCLYCCCCCSKIDQSGLQTQSKYDVNAAFRNASCGSACVVTLATCTQMV